MLAARGGAAAGATGAAEGGGLAATAVRGFGQQALARSAVRHQMPQDRRPAPAIQPNNAGSYAEVMRSPQFYG